MDLMAEVLKEKSHIPVLLLNNRERVSRFEK